MQCVAEGEAACLSGQIGFQFGKAVCGVFQAAFGGEEAFEAEAEAAQIGGVDVQREGVAAFAERAFGADEVVAEADGGVGAA